MEPGRLNLRATFRAPAVAGPLGAEPAGWSATPRVTVWARLQLADGGETFDEGRVALRRRATLTVRDSAAIRAVTLRDCVDVQGLRWNLRLSTLHPHDRGLRVFDVETDGSPAP